MCKDRTDAQCAKPGSPHRGNFVTSARAAVLRGSCMVLCGYMNRNVQVYFIYLLWIWVSGGSGYLKQELVK